MSETRVNGAGDFPNLAIYEREDGAVYSIVFRHHEWLRGWAAMPRSFGAILVIGLAIPGMVMGGQVAAAIGGYWIIGAAVVGIPAVIYLRNFEKPRKVVRAIELDRGVDRLRVLRDSRVEIERPLSRLVNLTVDEHPEAAFKRAERLEKGNQTLAQEEKEHCLFGWFGAGGAERVTLISRAEWPCLNSLFEVRQAILWVLERRPADDGPAAAEKKQGGGMNPPLD